MNTLTYVGMTLVGAAAMVYSVHAGRTINTTEPVATVSDGPSNPNELLATFLPLMDEMDAELAAHVDPTSDLTMGMTAFAVRGEMGAPPEVSGNGRVWRYPAATILFDDARQVVGWTKIDSEGPSHDRADFGNVFLEVSPVVASRAQNANDRSSAGRSSDSTRSTTRRRSVWSAPDSGRRYASNARQARSYRNSSRYNNVRDNRARLTSSWLYRTSRRTTSNYLGVPADQRRRVDVYGRGSRYEGRAANRSRAATNRVQRNLQGRFGTVRDGYVRGR